MNYTGHRDQHYGFITCSQHGEDLALVNLFALMGIAKPSYLDVGCHDAINISNTYLLYLRGSRGICVDANKNLEDVFKKNRPEDKLLFGYGVDVESGFKNFYMYDDYSGRNTFSESEVESLAGVMTVKTAVKLPVVTLNDIVNQHCDRVFPDLLSLDIEGYDYAVLCGADFSFSRPKIIIVETRRNKTKEMKGLLESREFNFIIHSRMGENLIFIDRGFWHAVF